MWERVEAQLVELSRRAGMRDVPPAVVATALIVAVLAVGWALWRWWPSSGPVSEATARSVATPDAAHADSSPNEPSSAVPPTAESPSAQQAAAAITVHIAGQVRRPGVYELAAGSRVIDGVDAAGGLIGDAASEALNLARPLADGEQVYVPSNEDVREGRAQGPSAPTGQQTPGVAGGTGSSGAQVNVNTADAAALETLPGVGPATAAKIISERESNGPFSSVEDLGRVSGIGPKRIEQLKECASVR